MRLIDRSDTPIVAGLVAGSIVLFQQPLHFLLDAMHDIEGQYHLDMVPTLIILSAVFAFHQYRKRRQSQAEAIESAAEIRQHLVQARELEALVTFGRLLANALDIEGLRHAMSRCLPDVLGERGLWVLVRPGGIWDVLSIDPVSKQELLSENLERIATRAMASSNDERAHREGVEIDVSICFPLVVGHLALGVMGVQEKGAALDASSRRALGVAASLLSIAVRNVHLLLETTESGNRDILTGCLNRKSGLDTLQNELRRVTRLKQPLSILMLDVDEFKQINDQHGHLAGDLVLTAIGRVLHTLRATDLKCRYGGDEFILILPDTGPDGAEHVAHAIRKTVMAEHVEFNGHTLSVTVSLGVACAMAGEMDIHALINRADQALYYAKKSGRNRSSNGFVLLADVAAEANVTTADIAAGSKEAPVHKTPALAW